MKRVYYRHGDLYKGAGGGTPGRDPVIDAQPVALPPLEQLLRFVRSCVSAKFVPLNHLLNKMEAVPRSTRSEDFILLLKAYSNTEGPALLSARVHGELLPVLQRMA